MSVIHYILKDHEPTPATLEDWREWMETADRKVARDVIDGATVSTVFLGMMTLDDNMFETMIFGGPLDEYQDRCSTWEEALIMHQQAITALKDTQK